MKRRRERHCGPVFCIVHRAVVCREEHSLSFHSFQYVDCVSLVRWAVVVFVISVTLSGQTAAAISSDGDLRELRKAGQGLDVFTVQLAPRPRGLVGSGIWMLELEKLRLSLQERPSESLLRLLDPDSTDGLRSESEAGDGPKPETE